MKEIYKLVLAASALTLLSACSQKTLDYRNAEVNNGLVYASDDNSPFSGTLTNIPMVKIAPPDGGFMKFINVINYDFPSFAFGNIGYSSICDVEIKKGMLNGDATCKTPQSDIVRAKMSFSKGALDGDFTATDVTGSHPFATVTFKDGQPNGQQKLYDPTTYALIYTNTWANGVLSGEEEGYYSDTGNLHVHATRNSEGRFNGTITVYAPDGKQLISQTPYVDGKKQGSSDVYDPPTGKHLVHANWDNGVLNGDYTEWDSQGNVTKHIVYDNGTDVEVEKRQAIDKQQAQDARQAVNDPTVAKCINDLTQTYVTERAGAADLSSARILAWRDQCRNAAQASTSGPVTSDGGSSKRCGFVTVGDSSIVLHDQDGMWFLPPSASMPGIEKVLKLGRFSCACLTVETNKQAMSVTQILDVAQVPVSTCNQDPALK